MSPLVGRSKLQTERQLRAILASLPDDPDGLAQACRLVTDWHALLLAAHEHGVASVVLASAKRASVPASSATMEAAAQGLRLDAVWRDVLRGTLRSILTALAEQGVPAVALKGPLLAARLYEDDAVRPSTDLDVLVDPASLDAAVAALRPLGYVVEGGRAGRFYREHHHHVHAFHPTLPVVELHFDAYRGFGTAMPAAPLLARSMPCGVLGWSHARVLAPEDEFLYLAVHAASHRFHRLVWLLDLKLLALRHPDLNWNHVAARAEAQRLSAVVSFTCDLLSDWLGAPRYGSAHLPPLGETRSLAAECLARPQSVHVLNVAADFLFCALLCDDAARAATFARRFVHIKVFHEAPRRALELFSN